MKKKVLSGFLAACLIPMTGMATESDRPTYSFGVVPQFDARQLHATWQPILDRVSELANIHFHLQGSPTIPNFEKEFNQGKFDLAYMNPFHSVMARDSQGYLPLVRDQEDALTSIIVVHKDSKIQDVRELSNQLMAFPAHNALGATLIPKADLYDRFGISVLPKYTQTHSSVYLNVALHQAPAGGGVLRSFNKQSASVRDKLRIIYRKQSVAPHPIVIHPRVPEKHRKIIQQAFLKLGTTREGRELLARIPISRIGPASQDDSSILEDLNISRFYQATEAD